MLVGGSDARPRLSLLRARRCAIFVLASSWRGRRSWWLASRHRPLEEAMLLGLSPHAALANSVNYHDHIVFLLPLLGVRRGLLASAAPLLAMCVADYGAALDPDRTSSKSLNDFCCSS